MEQKNLLHKKWFAVVMLLFGVFGLLLMAHHIFSYEAILRPRMDYLIENKIITNDIDGITFLRMFTNESNILVDLYLILFSLGVLGIRPLYRFTRNEWLRGAITLNIAVTGVIYFTVLLPFSKPFPMEKGIWFSNVVNIWDHLITPVFFTALWFFPVENKTIPKVKYALLDLIYPLAYFVMCIILGAKDGFYPYPFLNGQQMWNMLFKNQPYNALIGTLLLLAALVVLSAVFFGIACLLGGIHNKIVSKKKLKVETAI